MMDRVVEFTRSHGALVVALVSGLLAAPVALIPRPRLKWLLVAMAPLAVAVAVYWTPVWRGADPSEYSAWFVALVVPWYGAGLLASVSVCLVIDGVRAARR